MLIGIIILVIAISASISLAIQNSASKLIESYENSYDIEVNISMDRKSMIGNSKIQKLENGDAISEENRQEAMEKRKNLHLARATTYRDYAHCQRALRGERLLAVCTSRV